MRYAVGQDRKILLTEADRLSNQSLELMQKVKAIFDTLDNGDPDAISNLAYQIEQSMTAEAEQEGDHAG